MNFSSWITSRTAGHYAGNEAYYQKRQEQLFQNASAELVVEYELYQKWGGKLDVQSWLREKAANNNLPLEKIRGEGTWLLFRARNLSNEQQADFLLGQLNLTSQKHAEYAKLPRFNDFLSNEMLDELCDSMMTLLHSEGNKNANDCLQTALTYLRLSSAERYENYMHYRIAQASSKGDIF